MSKTLADIFAKSLPSIKELEEIEKKNPRGQKPKIYPRSNTIKVSSTQSVGPQLSQPQSNQAQQKNLISTQITSSQPAKPLQPTVHKINSTQPNIPQPAANQAAQRSTPGNNQVHPTPNVNSTSAETKKGQTDSDFITSLLDQVTSGLKNKYAVLKTTQPPPEPSQSSLNPQRLSPYSDMTNKPKKNKKNKKKRGKRKKNKVGHLDTPSANKEVDFDTEMDNYFAASAQKKEPTAATVNKQPVPRKTHAPNALPSRVVPRVVAPPFGGTGSVSQPPSAVLPSAQTKAVQDSNTQTAGSKRKLTMEQVADERKPQKKKNIWKKNNQPKKPFIPLIDCKYFEQGYCKDGDQCTFKHDTSKDPVACPLWIKGMCLNGDLCRLKHEGKRDIKICQYFKSNSCSKGDSCPFSHELSAEPCRFFHLKKTCEQGDNCPYSHEPLNPDSLACLRKLTGPCRFWQFKGYCVTGDACLFSHDDVSEEERKKLESTITPCIYYHTKNSCRSGNDCFYLHDEATPEQVRLLKESIEKKEIKVKAQV
ncbi:hypothetical protein BY458DRAFT_488310 [Sporodiniella umbellata]|nr:hypothetical protein BY458DRAFT_488310 [Sporodiniella umbellata]